MGAGQQTDADYEPGTRGQELHATDGGEVYPQETLQARTDLLSVRVNKKKIETSQIRPNSLFITVTVKQKLSYY